MEVQLGHVLAAIGLRAREPRDQGTIELGPIGGIAQGPERQPPGRRERAAERDRTSRAAGPLIRITATAARPKPLAGAKSVSVSVMVSLASRRGLLAVLGGFHVKHADPSIAS